MKVRVPPLAQQRCIADVLGALDDKIALNHRMNETLEAMAQALYRHWFTDFVPFQDGAFTESELGPIPEGWTVEPFLETCEISTGGTPKTTIDEYWGRGILWASAKDVSQNKGFFVLETERSITPEGVENSSTCILPKGTTAVVARGATTGRLSVLGRNMALNQTCYGLNGREGFSWGWTYLAVDSLVARLKQMSYGSVFDSVTISTFRDLKIVCAPLAVRRRFDDRTMPFFEKMLSNEIESEKLAETRDYLLPKLISGEVAVSAAEESIEANGREVPGRTEVMA